ncbi:hypothetical protein XCV2957 [Xanthomonas euvesicatoria pv. vesicatoria str. 85-10]|uniref:Uncharacterized protein n=1 Tax=Xanthomonas euvesicatoria pv. vesicatoria (strain 85-10) TaxID=316273 RepID=Q3BRC5_XANE5|nr:hypothetical protein XCV2957 [Xanthomonas euvesicatoria pv. vesicatoria str. 85-10]
MTAVAPFMGEGAANLVSCSPGDGVDAVHGLIKPRADQRHCGLTPDRLA